jgi:Ca2+/Na+ antiporter
MNYFFKFEYVFDLKERIETGIRRRIEEKRIKEAIKGSYEETESEAKIEDIRAENETGTETKAENEIEIKNEVENLSESSLLIEFIKLVAGVIAIIVGAKYFVEQSIFFALLLEIPETLIGVSLVAVGTSLPELMVTVSAARSGYASIAIGNVIGSNITNILLILGCSGLVHPLTVTEISIYYITPFMLFISLMLLLFIRTGWRIKRFEGLILFLLYSGFMVFIFRLG